MRLKELQDGLWVATGESRAAGVEFGVRMTVVRLKDGSLWVHSPIKLDPDLRSELDSLGPVRYVVSPNKYHHLYVRPFREAYPEARFHAAPGLQEKRRNFRFDATLGDDAPAEWRGEIEQVALGGVPMFNEVVFCHRDSRTLILTDLAFNIRTARRLRSKMFYVLWGVWKKFGPSRLVRCMVKDREAFRRSLRRVFDWDYDRVILAHGDVVESGGKETFQNSFDWL